MPMRRSRSRAENDNRRRTWTGPARRRHGDPGGGREPAVRDIV